MGIKFTDNALTILAANISDTDKTISVPAGKGDNFPTVTGGSGDFFVITMENAAGQRELIKVIHRLAGIDTFGSLQYPCERGYGGTLPRNWVAGDSVDLRLNAAVLDDTLNAAEALEDHENAGSDAHPATAIVVTPKGAMTAVNVQAALEQMTTRPTVQNLVGTVALTKDDINTMKYITAKAELTMPPSSDMAVGDSIIFKSLTEQLVKIKRKAAPETIDNDTEYQLPSYTACEVTKVANNQYILSRRPEHSVGDIVPCIGDPGRGWTLADDKELNRVATSGLFAVADIKFGAGDGATTYKKLDLRGRTVFGKDDMGGAAANRITVAGSNIAGNVLGATGGDQRMHKHNHAITDPGHAHSGGHVGLQGFDVNGFGGECFGVTSQGGTSGAATGITINDAGEGGSQNMPPMGIALWKIKT